MNLEELNKVICGVTKIEYIGKEKICFIGNHNNIWIFNKFVKTMSGEHVFVIEPICISGTNEIASSFGSIVVSMHQLLNKFKVINMDTVECHKKVTIIPLIYRRKYMDEKIALTEEDRKLIRALRPNMSGRHENDLEDLSKEELLDLLPKIDIYINEMQEAALNLMKQEQGIILDEFWIYQYAVLKEAIRKKLENVCIN